VTITDVDDGQMLLDTKGGTLFHVNRAGAVVLAVLAQRGASLEDAATALVNRYHLDRGRARADVEALVESLRARRLVIER
jgi:hypothetical protein